MMIIPWSCYKSWITATKARNMATMLSSWHDHCNVFRHDHDMVVMFFQPGFGRKLLWNEEYDWPTNIHVVWHPLNVGNPVFVALFNAGHSTVVHQGGHYWTLVDIPWLKQTISPANNAPELQVRKHEDKNVSPTNFNQLFYTNNCTKSRNAK